MPGSISANDILLLAVEAQVNQNVTLSTANGFAETASSPQNANIGGGPRLHAFWKRAAGADAAPVIADPGDHLIAVMCLIRGVKTTGNPWNISSGGNETTADTSGSIPGATTSVGDCLIVALATSGVDATGTAFFSGWTNTDLTNITERVDQTFSHNDMGSSSGGGIAIATGEKVASGAYGATTYTQSTATFKAFMTLAFEGVAAGGGGGAASQNTLLLGVG
jgi:hypothetical protein